MNLIRFGAVYVAAPQNREFTLLDRQQARDIEEYDARMSRQTSRSHLRSVRRTSTFSHNNINYLASGGDVASVAQFRVLATWGVEGQEDILELKNLLVRKAQPLETLQDKYNQIKDHLFTLRPVRNRRRR